MRIPKRALLVAAAALTGLVAFGVTTYATGWHGKPRLEASLPAASLPPAALPADEAAVVARLIAPAFRAEYGITEESFGNARKIASTEAGDLWLIPGAKGACLFLVDGVSCGDPGSPGQPMLSLFSRDAAGKHLVGGGVVTDTVDRVVVRNGGSVVSTLPVSGGVFTLSPEDGVPLRGNSFVTK
jgi:hypothetical protein